VEDPLKNPIMEESVHLPKNNRAIFLRFKTIIFAASSTKMIDLTLSKSSLI
jgi:hypothetical protein